MWPVDGLRHLRDLVHHLAVAALACEQEVDGLAGEAEVAVAIDGVEGPEGVAAEEPAEARAGGVAGGEPATGEAGAGGGSDAGLLDGDLGPAKGVVEAGVGRGGGETGVEEVGEEIGGVGVALGDAKVLGDPRG